LLIQQGESLAYVRDQGHASIQITVDTYGHLVPGGNRAAVDRLDAETQPNATQAQPDDVLEGVELPKLLAPAVHLRACDASVDNLRVACQSVMIGGRREMKNYSRG
jgi:hypothetical protein